MKSYSTFALLRPWGAAARRGAQVGAAGLLALAGRPVACAQGPTTSQNYVLTNTVLVPGKTSYGAVQGMSNFNPGTGALERQQQLTYADGLGRPIQQVQVQASPGRQDLILPIAYDVLGRPATTYLPYAGGGGGSFQPTALSQQNAFYQPNGVLDHVVNDAVPSATNLYEASPLARVLEQGAPGAAWQPGTRHTVKLNQRANYAGEVRQWTYDDVASPVCSSAGTYPAGTLVVKEVRDEQGGLVTEYQDLQGRLLLRKTAGTGTTCLTQPEGGNLTLSAPAGMGFVGIRSATWGVLLAGSTCDDARYDLTRRADVTSAVQSAVAAQLRTYPAPSAISVPATNQALGIDPGYGYGKVLLVEAIYAPATAPTNTDLSTYYIYDGLDNLRLVLQPEGAAAYGNTAASTSITLSDALMRTWCFRYNYDGRRRVVLKQVPGAGEQRFVYNQRDQVVLSQDANQAAQGPPQWTFIKYDGLSRPILTGLVTLPGETQASLQATLDADYVVNETPDTSSDVGYSLLNSFPRWTGWGHNPVTADNLLTITYYDHYSYSRLQNAQLAPTVPGSQRLSRATGLVTGSSVRTLGPAGPTSQWLTTATYFDQTYRPLQSLSQNQLGGVTTTASTYDFSKLLSTSTTQTTSAGQAFAQTNRFTYGTANRLETTYQSTAGQGEVILSRQTYNELGQLMAKRLHNDQPGTADSYLQKVDYRYNIRGWLTHLNNRDLNNNIEDSPGVYVLDPEGPNVEPDLFGLELRYDNMLHGGATAQFNGNIAQQMWQTRSPNSAAGSTRNNVLRVYNYGYDGLNRVTSGDYKVWNGSTWTASPTTDFSVSGITYDKSGNLLTMNRVGTTNGSNDNPVSGWLDKLRYTYTNSASSNGALTIGNRLLAVDDLAGSNGATHDFKDGHSYANTNQIEYTYDANGNLTSDSNKSLSGITYSVLNQPTKLDLAASRIEYDYAATGTKLQQRTYSSGTLRTTTYYVGPVVYEAAAGATPQPVFAHTSEGRVLNVGTSNSPYPWKYEYHLKDHLGNLRFAFRADRDNGTTTQVVGMEPANATREERQATHVAETRLADPAHARTGHYVARLEARSRRQGPSMRLAVRAGDSIRAEVYGRYDRDAAPLSLGHWARLLVGATAVSAPAAPGLAEQPLPAGASRRWRLPFVGLSLGLVPQLLGLAHKKLPTAYLRYELFTKDSQLVATQRLPIRRTATDTWQQLVAGTRADSTGFVHLSLFNESQEPAYFDDLTARTVAPLPYQENHYDPFGLNLVGIETSGTPNARYQYNGKEKQEDFNLNWIDYGARMYDATLGRFHTVDRYAEKYQSLTPYQYGGNNPISTIDINGDSLWITHNTGFLGSRTETLLYEDGGLFNKDGSEYTGKVKGFLKNTVNTLSKIGAGDAGKALLSGVQSSSKNITIAQETKTDKGNNTDAFGDGNSNVNFDLSASLGGVDIRGNRARPQFIGLAHELAHALDNANGTINTKPIPGWPNITYSELFATDMENKIRAENLLPLRAYYQYNSTTGQPEFPLLNSAGLSIYNPGYDYYGANVLQSRQVLLNTVPNPSTPAIK